MSTSAATEFVTKLNEDRSLWHNLQSEIGGFEQIDFENAATGDAVVKMGAEMGYDFTKEEAREAAISLRVQLLNESRQELSETQLDAVAGGSVTINIC